MWKQCGKKQQRIEEEARSPVVSLEYVNRRRHPDPSFDDGVIGESNSNEL